MNQPIRSLVTGTLDLARRDAMKTQKIIKMLLTLSSKFLFPASNAGFCIGFLQWQFQFSSSEDDGISFRS